MATDSVKYGLNAVDALHLQLTNVSEKSHEPQGPQWLWVVAWMESFFTVFFWSNIPSSSILANHWGNWMREAKTGGKTPEKWFPSRITVAGDQGRKQSPLFISERGILSLRFVVDLRRGRKLFEIHECSTRERNEPHFEKTRDRRHSRGHTWGMKSFSF